MKGLQLLAVEGGLIMPEVVKQEVTKYREQNDRTGEFIIKECLVRDFDGIHREKFSKIYKVYVAWCENSGYRAQNKKNFKNNLGEKMMVKSYSKRQICKCIEKLPTI